ncbi:MAG: ABC transporter substrate-binding protein, partial [Halobaculum sp.]
MDVPAGYLRRVNATVRTLDPVAAVADSSEAVVTKLHDGLVHHPNGELTPEPLLAADLDRDGETYTVRLREARFHDGRPVTAADVVYSFERV